MQKQNNNLINGLLLATILLLFAQCQAQTEQKETSEAEDSAMPVSETVHKRVNLAEFNEVIANPEVQLVDVRTPGEYAGGFIDDAVNIDYMAPDFLQQCEAQLDKDKPMAIYCAAGGRSAKALKVLKDAGFTKVYEFEGGYNGYPKK